MYASYVCRASISDILQWALNEKSEKINQHGVSQYVTYTITTKRLIFLLSFTQLRIKTAHAEKKKKIHTYCCSFRGF